MNFSAPMVPDAAITISPRGQGIMEVFVDGEKIFDKKAEGNVYPDLAASAR